MALLAGLAATATFLAAVLPVSGEAMEERRAALIRAAASRFQRDAGRLFSTSASVARSREFADIVGGGGAEMRPSQLFSVLSEALPGGAGWGAVFIDANGRAVAWAGEAIDVPVDTLKSPLDVSFHVTRFSLLQRTSHRAGQELRGHLIVSRVYPTGIVFPGLLEFFGWPSGVTRSRLRASCATDPRYLIQLGFEPQERAVEEEDVARRRALPFAVLSAALFLVLATQSRAPALALVASRLILLPGTPLSERGVFQELHPAHGHLFPVIPGLETPWDVFASGLCAAGALALLLHHRDRRAVSRRSRFLSLILGISLAPLPFLLIRSLAASPRDLMGGLNIVSSSLSHFLVRVGALALAAALLGAVSLLFARAHVFLPGGAAIPAGLILAFLASVSTESLLPAGLATCSVFCFSLALARRFGDARPDGPEGSGSRFPKARSLQDAVTPALLLAFAGIAGGAAVTRGRDSKMDSVLEQAERLVETLPRSASYVSASSWIQRLSWPENEPWLPAGERTLTSDLARAIWIRGGGGSASIWEEVLTILDHKGDVVSSFGRMRPGSGSGRVSVPLRIPMPGFSASISRVLDPRHGERDPLLNAVLEDAGLHAPALERVEFDAAGRPVGSLEGDRADLPPRLLAQARATGEANGLMFRPDSVLRVVVTRSAFGFSGFTLPAEPPWVSFGASVSAALTALPFLILVFGLSRFIAGKRDTRLFWQKGHRDWLFTARTVQGRLITLLLVSGALPLFGGIIVMRVTLEGQTDKETARRAFTLLSEARRGLNLQEGVSPTSSELNRAASFLGTDLLLYRGGRLVAASRALPVTSGLAGERLSPHVAESLAEGQPYAVAPAGRRAGGYRLVEGAVLLSRDKQEAIAVVVGADPQVRVTLDVLTLLAFILAFLALAVGTQYALGLSRSIEDVVNAAEAIGNNALALRLERSSVSELARLTDAFEQMSSRIRERTEILAREREAAVSLLSNLTAAVLLLRRRGGSVVFANQQADELLPGGNLDERFASPKWEALRTFLRRHFETREVVSERISAGAEDQRSFRVVLVPMPEDAGESRLVLLLEDLTEILRAERLSAWVDAARAVAHDIKNPLTPIRLAAERLIRYAGRMAGSDKEVLETSADVILRQVTILTERAGRLGRLSEKRTPEVSEIEPSAVADLLKKLAMDFGTPEKEVGITIHPDLPPVLAHMDVIRDGLTNLVLNAFEALGPQGGRIQIVAEPGETRNGARAVRFVCQDNGPGVTRGDLDRLFTPSFSTKARGSGLGLFATRRAVEGMGGEVFARRLDPAGLEIGFLLPAG